MLLWSRQKEKDWSEFNTRPHKITYILELSGSAVWANCSNFTLGTVHRTQCRPLSSSLKKLKSKSWSRDIYSSSSPNKKTSISTTSWAKPTVTKWYEFLLIKMTSKMAKLTMAWKSSTFPFMTWQSRRQRQPISHCRERIGSNKARSLMKSFS